ncbi:MAG: M28 family peptidase [Planctomycetes bacterium]|nr:M28 family peptidase [Planctomycetota bacterium]
MAQAGWAQLVDGWPWFRGDGNYPIPAYSEFLPPPKMGRKPYGADMGFFDEADPRGWPITEYEETLELRPGLEKVAEQIVGALVNLGNARPVHGFSKAKLEGNPYWPEALAHQAGSLAHERFVILLPLALSRTQDDKGRVRWTLFGASEQGPARAFWHGFYTAPKWELPEEQALGFFRRLLHAAYQEPEGKLADLHKAGLRILPREESECAYWKEEPLPSWTKPLLLSKNNPIRGVKYLLTFRPFGQLPAAVQKAYLAGDLHLLPFPGSLAFWGATPFRLLQTELPFACQIPLLHLCGRHEAWHGMRVPQAGWLHEARPDQPEPSDHHGPFRNTFKRTHRWGKVHRHEDELALTEREDKVTHVLFSAMPDDMGLYNKPMARNCQLWSREFALLLDGPRATSSDLQRATHALQQGGQFGYRFQYPAMRVGRHEIFWHRPLIAYQDAQSGKAAVLPDGPLGYLTAYDTDRPDLSKPIELWPRLLRRELHLAGLELFDHAHTHFPRQTTVNIRKLLDSRQLMGDVPLPRLLARSLLTVNKQETVDGWLDHLAEQAADPERGRKLVEELRGGLEPGPSALPPALTYQQTARRSFEVAYWKTIDMLAEGRFFTKNNADCVRDPMTQKHLPYHHRDLDALGDYLLAYYRKAVSGARMTGKALVGDLPFAWHTEFTYPWMGGWLNNQEGQLTERDIIVVIPGKDRSRAVIMGDHYDTAYMSDKYDPQQGGDGARLPASGADDNHSATAAMMLAAPIFLQLSKAGKLACDIWLVHLTGEEFPADCLGARHLCQRLVEGNLRMRLADGKQQDLSKTRVQGLYVSDMIAHNNDHDRDTFQISPGQSAASFWLAYQAHLATEIWNASTAKWNTQPARKNAGRGKRSPHGGVIPRTAQFLPLYGEVRPPYDPRSTLYNTDGQIFSDAGVPVVLFMENYDINRCGYHDTHDTMDNIDLDFGAALAAITIETVARAATQKGPL